MQKFTAWSQVTTVSPFCPFLPLFTLYMGRQPQKLVQATWQHKLNDPFSRLAIQICCSKKGANLNLPASMSNGMQMFSSARTQIFQKCLPYAWISMEEVQCLQNVSKILHFYHLASAIMSFNQEHIRTHYTNTFVENVYKSSKMDKKSTLNTELVYTMRNSNCILLWIKSSVLLFPCLWKFVFIFNVSVDYLN